jgi:DNA-binding winged helix-turn-helix (wHTH) protein
MPTSAASILRFGSHALDLMQCALIRGDDRVPLRPKTFDVLRHLVTEAGRLVSKEELMQAAWLGAAVSDDSVVQCIKELRRALDDTDRVMIKTVPRRGYLFAAEVKRASAPDSIPTVPKQTIVFGRTCDRVSIAVGSTGEGAPVVLTPTWFGHLEYEWRNPISAPLLEFLSQRYRLVRFDMRGTGLSDRDVSELSLDAFQRDCETALDAVHLGSYALFGISTPGAAIAIAHAVAHPERVSKLVLHGGFAQGRKRRNCPKDAEISDALLALLRHGWGDRHSPFMRMFVSRYLPNGSAEELASIAELQHMTTSRELAADLWRLWNEIDIVELLPRVQMPTLVLHCRHNDVSPFSEGRRMAASIPNASFVGLD